MIGQGSNVERILKRDKQTIAPALARHLSGFVISKGKGSIIEDVDGNSYIDFISGIAVLPLGYGRPEVIEAIEKQIRKYIHACATISEYEQNVALGEKLKEIAPSELKEGRVYFGTSGGEAVEACLKLAKYYTRRPTVIACQGGMHGRAGSGIGLTSSKSKYKKGIYPSLVEVVHIPYAYCYRCAFGQEYPECGMICVEFLRRVLETVVPPENVAAMIAEPIQCDGGVVVPPIEFFQGLDKILRENHILLIDDDVQTSLGRTGKMFGIEGWGVVPDLIAIAKSVGGGLPLGAMIARKEIADSWEPGAHSSTTGGNPVACVAGLTTLEIILKENLAARAEREGEYAIKRIRDMMDNHRIIGDVRGKGMILGIELVKDRESKIPAVEETAKVIRECFKKKLIVMGAGLGHVNVVRLLPALNIPREDLDQGLDILDESLATVE